MGVLSPFPRVDHEVAKTGARGCQSLRLPRLDRGGLDDGNQNSFGRVVAENNTRVLILSHFLHVQFQRLTTKRKQKLLRKVAPLFECFTNR